MELRPGVTPAICLFGLLFGSIAQAAGFGTPVQLSSNGHAATVSVAIDSADNALAAWADEGTWFSDHPAGGSWSAPQSVYVGGSFPVMRMTSQGAATIVSYTSGSESGRLIARMAGCGALRTLS